MDSCLRRNDKKQKIQRKARRYRLLQGFLNLIGLERRQLKKKGNNDKNMTNVIF